MGGRRGASSAVNRKTMRSSGRALVVILGWTLWPRSELPPSAGWKSSGGDGVRYLVAFWLVIASACATGDVTSPSEESGDASRGRYELVDPSRICTSFTPPAPLHTPDPEFPAQLRRPGIRGSVRVKFRIGTDGAATLVRVESATRHQFVQASEETLKQWRP